MKKLIVTIPAFNEEENIQTVIREIPRTIRGFDVVEVLVFDDGSTDRTRELAKAAGADYVVGHRHNKGLAITFKNALWEALKRGADVIVNTDGDNHYDQTRIADLALPVLEGRTDITIGSRKVNELEHMPFWNKHLNRLGSFILTKWVGMPRVDVSTGFRGYSREAATVLAVYSKHTYTHTTLLSAHDLHLNLLEVPIKARQVTRQSRLIKSVPNHLWKSGINIIRNIVLFRPLRFFGVTAALLFIIGITPVLRWLYLLLVHGDSSGHLQSLVLGGVLIILSFNSLMLGMLGSSIGWSRKVTEEALYLLRKQELEKQHIEPEEPVKVGNPPAMDARAYQAHDEEKIKERLKNLGYID